MLSAGKILALIAGIAAGAAVIVVGYGVARCVSIYYSKTVPLEKAAVPFSRQIPDAPLKILVLGDSTAVGTGSADPALTTAGRLGALYPQASVTNLAVNGLKLAGLEKIMAGLGPKARFDLVLIQIGANDIIQLTPMADIAAGIGRVLAQAKGMAPKVIVLHSGDIGESSYFPFWLDPLLTRRSYAARSTYEAAASSNGASYVDLIDSPAAALLRQDPGRYYAGDGLHLTGDGYGLWFAEIEKKL